MNTKKKSSTPASGSLDTKSKRDSDDNGPAKVSQIAAPASPSHELLRNRARRVVDDENAYIHLTVYRPAFKPGTWGCDCECDCCGCHTRGLKAWVEFLYQPDESPIIESLWFEICRRCARAMRSGLAEAAGFRAVLTTKGLRAILARLKERQRSFESRPQQAVVGEKT